MRRRSFVGAAAAGPIFGAAAQRILGAGQRGTAAPASGRMKCGTQHGTTDEILRTCAAFGVNHVCSTLPSPKLDEKWSVEGLTKLRERVESFGLRESRC